MQPILYVYLGLILLVLALYFISQKLRKGPKQGFVQWLKSGFGVAPLRNDSEPTRPLSPSGTNPDDVVAVLEDLYDEFMGEIKSLKQQTEERLRTLEEERQTQRQEVQRQIQALREELSMLQETASVHESPVQSTQTPTVDGSVSNVEPAESLWAKAYRSSMEPVDSEHDAKVLGALSEAEQALRPATVAPVEPALDEGMPDVEVPASVQADAVVADVPGANVQAYAADKPSLAEAAPPTSAAAEPLSVFGAATGSNRTQRTRSGERYFEILDELHAGKSPLEISRYLRVSLEDVEHVQRIMNQPIVDELGDTGRTSEQVDGMDIR